MSALEPWQEWNHQRLTAVRVRLAARFGPKPIPTLHEYISASHSMLLAMRAAQRRPPRPAFVHCWACRVPVTPSGRRALITEPPTGSRKDVDALCHIVRLHRRPAVA